MERVKVGRLPPNPIGFRFWFVTASGMTKRCTIVDYDDKWVYFSMDERRTDNRTGVFEKRIVESSTFKL